MYYVVLLNAKLKSSQLLMPSSYVANDNGISSLINEPISTRNEVLVIEQELKNRFESPFIHSSILL